MIYSEGTWEIFHSENNRDFLNRNVEELLTRQNLRLIHGSPYHLQSQRLIEMFNRTLKSRIKKCLPYSNLRWIYYVDRIFYDRWLLEICFIVYKTLIYDYGGETFVFNF